MAIECYAITHSGEGDRGEKVEFLSSRGGGLEWCAEQAAEYFQGQEMRTMGIDDEDVGCFDGTSQVIEVVGHPRHPEPVRFTVRCHVVRQYQADRI